MIKYKRSAGQTISTHQANTFHGFPSQANSQPPLFKILNLIFFKIPEMLFLRNIKYILFTFFSLVIHIRTKYEYFLGKYLYIRTSIL